jgi:hypothetical protein
MAKTKKRTEKKVATKAGESVEPSEDKVSKKIVDRENRQMLWFFIIIAVVIASVLISYFYVQNSKSFEFEGINWVFEDYGDFSYYHGRFLNLISNEFIYNIYLRNDPRKNDVPTEGTFDKFKYGVVISTSPEFDSCRGDASRVMRDLGAFMREGFGAGPSEPGSTDENVAINSERLFARCDNIDNKTVLVVDVGEKNSVIQDKENINCYTILVEDCDDASSAEKFMLKVIKDFGNA